MTGEPANLGRIGPAIVWRLDLDVDEVALESAWRLLSEGERARARSLVLPGPQRRYVAARAGLRRILSARTGRAPDALDIRLGPHGKPALPGGPAFSLSHSDGLGLCAVVDGREVGIDVERVRPVPEAGAIVDRWFTEAERRTWRSVADPEHGFLRLWTRREAFLKALGVGFSDDGIPSDIDLASWEVHEFHPGDGYIATMIVERCPPWMGLHGGD